jgi:hypothetical protein
MDQKIAKLELPEALSKVIKKAPRVLVPDSKQELYSWVFGPDNADKYSVSYDVDGKSVTEAEIVKCRNGAAVNFVEDYMRRREPECMRIGDELATDKPRFSDVHGYPFSKAEQETYDWLATQELILMPFKSGGRYYGYDSLLVCPLNAAFFAFSLAQLQAFVSLEDYDSLRPRAIVYVAPPFRHTHFSGKQVVVHNRCAERHEIFSYNLYPGPSAKKGIYSVLLDIGESEGWVTAHASAARRITPYENEIVMMHEGASGGGKSELLQDVHRSSDGRVLVGTNMATGEQRFISMSDTCTIQPVTDDMAMCHPGFRNGKKLGLFDGEEGWFVRTDGITEYGADPMYERITIHAKEPLVFYSLHGVPNATCLVWEHQLNSDGKPCSNPRVIVPRELIDNVVTEPVEVDVRSFGVRMPPSMRMAPNFGIMGMLQIIPPALAWLWRLVSPRGYNNPSIDTSASSGQLESEGVGSYWPFATGLRTTQANLLLEQIMECPDTKYVLIPNQFIGVVKIGFMAEWISREFLARRGGVNMKMDRLVPARCALMGYSLKEMKVDGQNISSKYLHPERQETLGEDGYDAGAEILYKFFSDQLAQYDLNELDPLGRKIIEVFKKRGSIEDYCKVTPIGLRP